jgi:predicted dehydrogenase
MINAGVIGLGVGEQHLITLLNHDYIEKVFIFDHDNCKLRDVHARCPDAIMVRNEHEIIGHPNCQLVCIASYDSDHCRQILACINADQNIFVEKPVCLKLNEAKSIIQELKKTPDIRFSSNLILRRSARFMDVKERVKSGDFGELYSIDADYLYGRVNKLTEGWRGEIDNYSVFLGGGLHMLDLVRWLSGKEAVSVFAHSNKIVTQGSPFRYDDFVSATIMFDGGMHARITANFGCVHPHYHALKIFGTKATFINGVGPAKLYNTSSPDDNFQFINTAYPGCEKGDLLVSYIDEVKEKSPPAYTIEDIFESMAVCFAVERSIKMQNSVDVNEIRQELSL